LQMPHFYRGFLSAGCYALHRIALPVVSEWYQEAEVCWRMRKNYERLCIIAQPLV
jgi:hypothetical protein